MTEIEANEMAKHLAAMSFDIKQWMKTKMGGDMPFVLLVFPDNGVLMSGNAPAEQLMQGLAALREACEEIDKETQETKH